MDANATVTADRLWDRLGTTPDRRGRKGRQYGLAVVLTLALAAMQSGANDLRAIFRWGRRLPPEALFLLGLERAPCHAMDHYFFKALDVEAAEAVLGDWVRGSDPLGHVALDGKRLRGPALAGHDGSAGVHLVAAFASRLGGVIGQLQVEPDGNKITAALALLKALPLQGTVITGEFGTPPVGPGDPREEEPALAGPSSDVREPRRSKVSGLPKPRLDRRSAA